MDLAPAGPRPCGRAADRRRARPGSRADVRRVGEVIGDDLGAGLADVSEDGAGVRLTAPVTVGETLQVCLLRRDGHLAAKLRGRVHWCRPIGGGLYAAGLGFDQPLGLSQLAGLI
jgi:hypothetical protein